MVSASVVAPKAPQYFTGILILCMTTTYILFMSHMHALKKFHHGAKSLVNAEKKSVLTHHGRDAMIFFTSFLLTIDPTHHIYNIQLTENVFQ